MIDKIYKMIESGKYAPSLNELHDLLNSNKLMSIIKEINSLHPDINIDIRDIEDGFKSSRIILNQMTHEEREEPSSISAKRIKEIADKSNLKEIEIHKFIDDHLKYNIEFNDNMTKIENTPPTKR